MTEPLRMGVDNLVGVEMRAWAKKDLRADVSVFEILSNMPMYELARMLARRSALLSSDAKGGEETADVSGPTGVIANGTRPG